MLGGFPKVVSSGAVSLGTAITELNEMRPTIYPIDEL